MKWTLTSPDGIGDFLLRVPWLMEMERQGWELQLLAREPTLEAARLVGLSGDLVSLSRSPYSKATRSLQDPFASVIAAIQRHHPELLFFGPSQPSFLEEQLMQAALPLRLGGFVLKEDFWPSESILPTRVLASAYELKVEVRHCDSEPERNQRAASQLLRGKKSLRPLRIGSVPTFADRSDLPNEYLVLSPGYRVGDYFTGLGTEKWVRELRELENRLSTPFVFTGSAGEMEANANIRQGLRFPERHLDWTGRLTGVCDLAGVLAAGSGYIGKDSGAMHLAAALGKPVVAVFGGGHWKRFLPTGTKAAVLTVEVPCRGCDWRCHLPEPLCARDIPEGSVADAWEGLMAGAGNEVTLKEYTPSRHALEILAQNPQDNFPVLQHAERRAQIEAQRLEALRSPFQRILEKLRICLKST